MLTSIHFVISPYIALDRQWHVELYGRAYFGSLVVIFGLSESELSSFACI